ncbi:MAG: porin family protein [Prolixibacteraceae bacterium]
MKRFIISSLLVAFVLVGFGQKHIRLSFAGSPSVNWMGTNNSSDESGKLLIGYDFGLNADVYFSEDERYSLLTGLQISNIGGEITYQPGTDFLFADKQLPTDTRIKYRLRYVEIPLAIKLKTDQFHRLRYWGQFGLSGMVNIEAKGDTEDSTLKKTNINDELNLFNLAMNVGLGIDYDLGGSNSISTGLVFQNGLTDVTTDNYFDDKTIVNSLKLKIALIF